MRSFNTEALLSIFPPALRKSPDYWRLAQVIAPELEAAYQAAVQCEVLCRVDELPENVLDALAYNLDVFWWNQNASLSEKREGIKQALASHRRLGTTQAVQDAINTYLGGGVVEEWFDYSGDPFYFQLFGADVSAITADYPAFLRVMDGVKRFSAVLDTIKRTGTLNHVTCYEEPLVAGESFIATFVADDGYTLEGAEVSVKMGGADITSIAWNFGAVVIDEVTGSVEINIDAVKIEYVIATASDLTLQLYQGKQAIKAYVGTDTAVELPTQIEVNGVTYATSLWQATIPNTVEHLKIIGIPPTYSTLAAMKPVIASTLKTFWGDGTYDIVTTAQAERIFVPDKSSFNNFVSSSEFQNKTVLRTARQLQWPQTTLGNTRFYGCTNLVDGGTIPSHVTSIASIFQNATKVRRFKVESKTANSFGTLGVPYNCICSLHIDSALFDSVRSGANAVNATPKLVLKSLDDTQISEVFCIGDSLTLGVGAAADHSYPKYLFGKVSNNTIVWNGGKGSTTSAWALDRINSNQWKWHKKGSVYVVWTGTNGNGSDNTIATLKTVYQNIYNSLPESNLLFIPATPAAIAANRATYDALVQWCIETFGAQSVFDVYAWFDSLGFTRTDFMYDSLHYDDVGYAIIAQGICEKLSANNWIETDYVPATAFTLDQSTVSLSAGGTAQLTAMIEPNEATEPIVWFSKNTSVATVSSTGLVTAIAAGTAKIMCVIDKFVAICDVIVS